ncbi:methyl-accepting chemotaxis protein [Amantichitinum ursilacus]|uniref:Methyl-accepting chemotaxis protein PctB n=1 Tax=Amantichitinum ursilacus TaxID=857265 RepID=A0A0N0XKM9_9NEIS|nr:methyl-accepting chemotaxis protein [Amantichitinum ursilacus]KPC54299.1 Methyl-accepting chemotaxis protein PctB [Amantichitinum ursilacus]
MAIGLHSLQQRIVAAVAAFVIVTGVVIAGAAYSLSAAQQQTESRQQISAVGSVLGVHIGNWISAKAQVLNAFKPVPHDASLVATMGFVRDAGGYANVFLAYPDGTQQNANGVVLPPDNNDPRKWHWWSRAQDEKSATFVEMPSVAAATGAAVSSFAHAVVDNGQVVGVLGADVEISSIMQELKRTVLPGDGFAFIVNKDGKIFAHGDPQQLNKDATVLGDGLTAAVISKAQSSNEFATVDINGRSKLVAAFPVVGTEFTLVAVSDEATLLAPLRQQLIKTAVILIVILIIVIALSWLSLKAQLRGLLRVRDAMRDISRGEADLTRRIQIQSKDEVGETAEAFNQFVEQLNRTFVSVRDKSLQLAGGVEEVRNSVQQVARDTNGIADVASANAAAIEEVSVSVSEIASSAQETDEVASRTGQQSRDSAKDLNRITGEMEATSEAVRSVAAMLDTLAQRSQQIRSITGVISEIASQTNLLALNAAIEAARAGEQGRGFAVVADEVRKLAERTGGATVEITGMLEAIGQETGNAAGRMQGTLDTVTASSELTRSAGDRLLTMADSMQNVVDKISGIALATQEQRNAATSMGQTTESINNRIAQADADLQTANQRLQTLAQLAQAINADFGRFKL